MAHTTLSYRKYPEEVLRGHLPKGKISYAFAIPDIYFSTLLRKTYSGDSLLSWCAGNILMSSLNFLCCKSCLILNTVGNPQREAQQEYLEVLQQMELFGNSGCMKKV